MSKACRSCGQLKAPSEFYKAAANPDGLQSYCKACDKAKRQAWREANRDKDRATGKKLRQKPERKRYLNEWRKDKRKKDPVFRARVDLSSRISNCLRLNGYGHKADKLEAILGCSFDDLQAHLMQTAINRYGYWLSNEAYHIDHVIPLAQAQTEAEILALNHFSNLQLLTPVDNLTKGDRVL